MTRSSQRAYQFQFNPHNFSNISGLVKLEDNYTRIPILLSLTEMTKVNFVINADAGSQVANRFRVVFMQSGTVPVSFSSVKAYRKNNNIKVEWKVENELNISKYEVERSGDGAGFIKMNTTVASGNARLGVMYSWIDAYVINGYNFYRIRSIGLDGKVQYSQVVKVSMDQNDKTISVYPNPVAGKLMIVQFNNQPAGLYTLRLSNTAGQLLMTKALDHTGGTDTKIIPLPITIKTGNYQLQVIGKDLNELAIKIFVQ